MSNFKVIVVGAGPVGLFTAHVLDRAGINYVVLEKRDPIHANQGGGHTIWPSTVRLFHQVGLMEKLEEISTKLKRYIFTDPTGRVVQNSNFWANLEANHGYPCIMVQRMQLIKMLHDTLPDKTRVKTGKRVVRIDDNGDGSVVVECDDGTIERGSVVVGVDGVWSRVRQEIAKSLPLSPAKLAEVSMPFTARYTAVFGLAGPLEGSPHEIMIERRAPAAGGIAFNIFPTPDKTYFIAYRSWEPTKEFVAYNSNDADEFVKEFLDVPILDGFKFRDIWDKRTSYNMTQVHEGMAKIWHSGRLVITGDAAHKVTPNLGAGIEIGLESAASLVNHLRTLLQVNPQPDTAALNTSFAAYQREREHSAAAWVGLSTMLLRSLLWVSSIRRFAFMHFQRVFFHRRTAGTVVSARVAQSVILDFVPFKEAGKGRVGWKSNPGRASALSMLK
ncbi:hypothetical protein BX600DRAFT_514459 [Xylariales sp. PMI_506]|nr:hypothetical protein BX600DRAFT_514459 [Xylariales sp. PMI_506]